MTSGAREEELWLLLSARRRSVARLIEYLMPSWTAGGGGVGVGLIPWLNRAGLGLAARLSLTVEPPSLGRDLPGLGAGMTVTNHCRLLAAIRWLD